MQFVLVYLQPFQCHSLLSCALQPEIANRVQGYSKSSMMIHQKTLSPVLVMISIMSVPICNWFRARWANSSKKDF